ncbi:hypothetical protein [Pedobacter sp. CFBP9032]|uniref:hypothetical protein n=1 Tax=Pedobacter sp. CFBP9032 TaxID=3096539 RepID=UPI002A6A8C5C|nr:hypothetical protein [Pedobacter sp. CFBP9032]MDY0904495.1 hypothetical protein [Pedobacter sp. CFBP9032]
MDQSVIPECFVDTNLIETLVPPQKQYNHQKGCGTVTKVMRERFTDRFALGIIDKDKKEVDYLKEFEIICSKGSLILHKHQKRHHYIIQIYPAMERFIMNTADTLGISLKDFDLPIDLNLLKKESKTINSKNDKRFNNLFKFFKKNSAEEIQRLTAWITYLKEKNYDVVIKEIQLL